MNMRDDAIAVALEFRSRRRWQPVDRFPLHRHTSGCRSLRSREPTIRDSSAWTMEAEGAEVVQHGTRHVRVDDRDRLWLSRRGVLVYDGEEWHPFSAGLPDVHFSDTRLTYEDSEGNIWVGLWGGGLIFCDPSQHSAIRQKRRPTRQRGPVSERRPGGPDLDWHDRRLSLLRGPAGSGRWR